MIDNFEIVEIVDGSEVIEIIEIKPRGSLEEFSHLVEAITADNDGHFVTSSTGIRKHFGYSLGYFLAIQGHRHSSS